MKWSYCLFLAWLSAFNSNFGLDYFIKKQCKQKRKINSKCSIDSCWIASHLIDKVISIIPIVEMKSLRFQ